MATSTKLGYTELTQGVDGTVFANGAFFRLEHALVINAKSMGDTSPPGSPAKGDAYILGASATGAWSGEDGKVAVYDGTSWVFTAPDSSMIAYVDDVQQRWAYDANEAEWYPLQPIWSATEHWTGKFKDGSKVYSKVIDFGALPNTTTKSVAHGVTGMDMAYEKAASLEGYASDGTTHVPLVFVTAAFGVQTFTVNATNILGFASVDRSSFDASIRLEYCKT
jgi:hypothetical protein